MDASDTLSRIWDEILARPQGPMALRFYLQPLMASFFAVRDGIRDAHKGRIPYFWSLFSDPRHRGERLRSEWRSTGKLIILAVVLDLIYQAVVLEGFRPLETLIVAVLVAVVPYVLLRGVVNRIVSRRIRAF